MPSNLSWANIKYYEYLTRDPEASGWLQQTLVDLHGCAQINLIAGFYKMVPIMDSF